jgi:hypothetical protein
MQEHIRIFPSKFNYIKNLPFINTIVLLSFYKNKKIKKNRILDFFLFLVRKKHFYTII